MFLFNFIIFLILLRNFAVMRIVVPHFLPQ